MESEEKKRFEELIKWAGEQGITDSNTPTASSCLGQTLRVAHYPQAGGRGLGAVRDLRKGELVLRVPKSALLTVESLSEDHRFRSAVYTHRTLSSIQILIVGILYEVGKGKSSHWYLYLKHLPRSYDTLASFGQLEIQALQVEDAIWTAEKATSKADLDWKEAKALMAELNFKPHLLSFKAWLWASGTVSTRTLHIPWDSSGCLCPVGDLFNYAAPGGEQCIVEDIDTNPDCSSSHDSSLWTEATEECIDEQSNELQRLTDGGFEKDLNAYCFYARENYKRREQVLLSYGTHTNLELLEHYGFLLKENPNDKVFIPMQSDIYAISSWPIDTLFIHQGGKPSFSLLSALRLWAVPPGQRKSVGHLVYSGVQLSLGNEMTVMDIIVKKCNGLLKNMPTCIEEDMCLLSAITKMQDSNVPFDFMDLSSQTVRNELKTFIEANGLQFVVGSLEFFVPIELKRSLARWKLAVMWRLSYKEILHDCISYCTKVIDTLSGQIASQVIDQPLNVTD